MNVDLIKLMQGKQFVGGGRGPDAFDCWGICKEAYQMFNKDLPDDYPLPIGKENIDAVIRSEIRDNPYFQRLDKVDVPCLVGLMIRPPYVSHIGVMINDHEFVHILEKSGVGVVDINHPFWKKRIYGFYKFIEQPEGMANE